MNEKACRDCEYECAGGCRRYPPTAFGTCVGMRPPVIDGGEPTPHWLIASGHPLVKPDQWCGEFSPKVWVEESC